MPAGVTSSAPATGNTGFGSGVPGLGNLGGGQDVGIGAPGVAWPLVEGDGGTNGGPTTGIPEPIGPGSPDGPGEPGAGGRGATGAAVDEAAVARGGAGASEVNETPIGPFGVGRGRKGDDDEHERASYLDESDPNKLYGIQERLAPRVIGEQ